MIEVNAFKSDEDIREYLNKNILIRITINF